MPVPVDSDASEAKRVEGMWFKRWWSPWRLRLHSVDVNLRDGRRWIDLEWKGLDDGTMEGAEYVSRSQGKQVAASVPMDCALLAKSG